MSVSESVFFFGEEHPLLGILSECDSACRKTGVVLLNSGLVHRAGPFRLGVEISRELAETGIPVLRFDQSARGDSERRRGASVLEEAEQDIEAAKSVLRSEAGVERIVLAGLCSGADDIVRHVSKAEDVDGMILMDPMAPLTRKYHLVNLLARVGDPGVAYRFACRKIGLSASKAENTLSQQVYLGAFREFPDDQQARSAFRQIKSRNGASLCLFTGGVSDYYNYRGQLLDGFGLNDLSDCIEEVFFEAAEHTYPLTVHRRRLLDTITEFCNRRFQ